MTEENRREIKTPAGTFRLTEEGARREFGPPPEEMERIQRDYAQSRREREEREKAGKINLDELRRQQGGKEIAEFRQTQRNLWVQHGGTDAEFESSWPQIKSDYLKKKAEAAYANVRSPFDR